MDFLNVYAKTSGMNVEGATSDATSANNETNEESVFKNYFDTTKESVMENVPEQYKSFFEGFFEWFSNFLQGLQDAFKEKFGLEYDFFNIDPNDSPDENENAVLSLYNSVAGNNNDKGKSDKV